MRTWLIVIGLAVAVPAAAQDRDRDGLSDRLEQDLLERFTPTFLLSRGECDAAPSSFAPFAAEPRVVAKDGTLYGQAFLVPSTDDRSQIELHFYHLWSRDCGRLGHQLDAEHVSAIVSATSPGAPATEWFADAWYAAAHEASACDASSGALAAGINATASGPRVFISRGKHASYLDRGQCKWGCGSDECDAGLTLVSPAIINIGERDAPLNGATWVQSARWPLSDKLQSDFDPAIRASLDGSKRDRIVSLKQRLRAPQAPVLAGDAALDGLETAVESTTGAFATAKRAVARFFRRK